MRRVVASCVPPRPLCRQVIGGGIGRADLLRSVGLNRANPVDGNIGGVGGLPGQSRGLAGLNGIGTDGDGGRW